jgi:two-component system response regulator AtoC
MEKVRKEVQSALFGTSSILILGENGTGKTALARAIAEAAGQRPIVRAVLGASDDLNTITSELFGHERGAFSGAMAKRVGLVELAKGGVLILDEILNLPRHAQQLLLDFTQFGTFRPLGYERAEPRQVKVRLIAATNGDLDQAMKENRFRMDLYYRLAGVVLKVPALRERRDEIPWLAESYLLRSDPAREWRLSMGVRRQLVSRELDWPGNVRQLEALVTRARERAIAEDASAVELAERHFELGVAAPAREEKLPPPADSLPGTLDGAERAFLEQTLRAMNGNVRETARAVGVSRATIYRKLQKHGLI